MFLNPEMPNFFYTLHTWFRLLCHKLLPESGLAWRWSACGTAEVLLKPSLLWWRTLALLYFWVGCFSFFFLYIEHYLSITEPSSLFIWESTLKLLLTEPLAWLRHSDCTSHWLSGGWNDSFSFTDTFSLTYAACLESNVCFLLLGSQQMVTLTEPGSVWGFSLFKIVFSFPLRNS